MFCNFIPTKAAVAKSAMKNAAPEYPMILYVLFLISYLFCKDNGELLKT